MRQTRYKTEKDLHMVRAEESEHQLIPRITGHTQYRFLEYCRPNAFQPDQLKPMMTIKSIWIPLQDYRTRTTPRIGTTHMFDPLNLDRTIQSHSTSEETTKKKVTLTSNHADVGLIAANKDFYNRLDNSHATHDTAIQGPSTRYNILRTFTLPFRPRSEPVTETLQPKPISPVRRTYALKIVLNTNTIFT